MGIVRARTPLALLVLLIALALIGVVVAPGQSSRPPYVDAGHPCGTRRPGSSSYTHVIWIWMENHGYGEIIGSGEAPYINSLALRCGLATNYHNIGHPSLPNYIAATSGLPAAALARFGSDCNPSAQCQAQGQSLFAQLHSWRAYEESMPTDCDRHDAGEYAVRHNPPAYYAALSGCARFDVPYTRLAGDLAHAALAQFSFITPNLTGDMHDGTTAQGDAWLQTHLPAILRSSSYRAGSVVVFITWDEGEDSGSDNCATNTTTPGCHVATLVVSPSTRPGTRAGMLFNHYSLLASTERLLRVPLLGQAAGAASMVGAFGL